MSDQVDSANEIKPDKSNELEDAEDLAAAKARAEEPTLPFEQVVQDLKRRGRL